MMKHTPLLLLLFAFIGCGTPLEKDALSKTQLLVGAVVQVEDQTSIQSVTVTIKTRDFSKSVLLEKDGEQWQIAVESPLLAGQHRKLYAIAKDTDGNIVAKGELTHVEIQKGSTHTVLFSLHPNEKSTGELPFFNVAPFVSSLSASSYEVNAGQTLDLSAVAGDSDLHAKLTYRWAGQGSFSQRDSLLTQWTAPLERGLYQLTFTVTDEQGAESTMALVLNVKGGKASHLSLQQIDLGKARVRARFNNWPVVKLLWAKEGSLKPGQSTRLFSRVMDPDFGPRTFQWSDNCGGSFDAPNKRNPKWTAPTNAPGNTRCVLSLKVTDRKGGTGKGHLTLLVGHQTQLNLSPQIQSTFQTADRVARGSTVVFRIAASDPEGATLRFRWFAFWGRLRQPTHTNTTSQIHWEAPRRPGNNFIYALIVDRQGAWSFEQFVIRVH